jgi:RNA polymerase sigma factor (TIGR02999 family)
MQKAAQSGEPAGHDVSTLLRAWSAGDQSALERLTPIVYDELHRLARRYMKGERPGHSLQTTALVNEAYTRLVDYKRMQWQDRAHFFAVSAQLMRRILVEHARRHNLKRGAGVQHVSLEEAAIVGGEDMDLVALDDAMNTLARLDPRGRPVQAFSQWNALERRAVTGASCCYGAGARSTREGDRIACASRTF